MIFNKNIFTNVLGLGRSLLAFSLILTLAFSSDSILFPKVHLDALSQASLFTKMNLFFVFKDYLFIARIISFAVLIFVISGFLPSFSGILHWYISFSFYNAAYVREGGDQLMCILTLILVPITILDNRRNHWFSSLPQNKGAMFIANFLLVFIWLQMSAMYFQAAVDKVINVEEWRNGTAIFYYFNSPLFGLPDNLAQYANLAFQTPFILNCSTWIILLFEIILAVAVFLGQKSKRKLFFPAVGFHLFIAVFFGLVSFFVVACGALVFYLLPLEKNLSEVFSRNKKI